VVNNTQRFLLIDSSIESASPFLISISIGTRVQRGIRARTTFDEKGRDVALSRRHARIVEDAAFCGSRSMSPRIKGVVQPRSWFIDIAPMSIQ
jgi:hypothetical protein